MKAEATRRANNSASTETLETASATKTQPWRWKLFQPRPSPNVQTQQWDEAILADGDLWVERSYQGKTGMTVHYYCNMRTNACQLLEPPTGATLVVYKEELHKSPRQVQEFAARRLSLQELRNIPRPQCDEEFAERLREVESRQKEEQRRQGQRKRARQPRKPHRIYE